MVLYDVALQLLIFSMEKEKTKKFLRIAESASLFETQRNITYEP